MKDFESTIIEKNITITKLEHEIEEMKSFRITNESLKKEVQRRAEEVGVLKAKVFLDKFSLDIKVVPEYPDLFEENKEIMKEIYEKNILIERMNKDLEELKVLAKDNRKSLE